MIRLPTGYLVFKTPDDAIPCAGGEVNIEFTGEAAGQLDPELLRHATAGVLFYFREELGRDHVTVAEFCAALAQVLRKFGFDVEYEPEPEPAAAGSEPEPSSPPPSPAAAAAVLEADLLKLASEFGVGFELGFFPRLRQEVEERLSDSPSVLRFTGLRRCVKRLAGARRWTPRCQALHDRIVDYLRECWRRSDRADRCSMLVK